MLDTLFKWGNLNLIQNITAQIIARLLEAHLRPFRISTAYMVRSELVAITPIISAAEVFFQPHIEANKKIATSHFPNFELSSSSAAIPPGDRDSSP